MYAYTPKVVNISSLSGYLLGGGWGGIKKALTVIVFMAIDFQAVCYFQWIEAFKTVRTNSCSIVIASSTVPPKN